jgi:hypothetical protein
MPTNSEDIINNPSENLPDNDRRISPQLTSDLRGVTYGLTYDRNSITRPASPLAPTGLIFSTTGVSNGYASRVDGITDFNAYNDYIHYSSVGDIGGGAIGSALGSAGITNVSTGASGPRFNVYNSLKKATIRFEMYSREYRI